MIAYIVLFGGFAIGAIGVWCTQCSEKRPDPAVTPIVVSPASSYNTHGPDHL